MLLHKEETLLAQLKQLKRKHLAINVLPNLRSAKMPNANFVKS
jgi:hypothetical protein